MHSFSDWHKKTNLWFGRKLVVVFSVYSETGLFGKKYQENEVLTRSQPSLRIVECFLLKIEKQGHIISFPVLRLPHGFVICTGNMIFLN